MDTVYFNWKKIKLPTIAFAIYILLIPFEAILFVNILVNVSYATIAALVTSMMVLIYLLFKPDLVKLTKSAVPWVAFFLWAGISIYWTVDRSISSYSYIYITKHLFFFLLICSYPFNFSEKRIIRHAVIMSGLILSAAIFFNTYSIGGISNVVRSTIAQGYYKADPNHIASSLLLPISFLIVDFVESKKFNLVDAAAVSVLFIALVITGSRGAFIAFLCGVVVLAILYRNFRNQKKIILAIIFTLAIAGTSVMLYNPSIFSRYAEIDNLDRYSANRTIIWRHSIDIWKIKPYSGYGFGTFAILQSTQTQKYKTAHNIYIQSLVEGGTVALVLLAIATIPMIRFRTHDSFSRAAKTGVVVIFVTSLFLFTINYDYFWLAMMLGEIAHRSSLKPKPQKTIPPHLHKNLASP